MSITLDHPRFARDAIAEVKTAPLHRLIGENVKLARDGTIGGSPVHVGLCPFHAERTPSFTVYKDHYHCFGCGAHGDHIAWLMKGRGMSFPDAMAHLNATPPDGRPQVETTATPRSRNPSNTVDIARRCWAETVAARGTIVETYLAGRGLYLPDVPDLAIRFHPRCRRGPRDVPSGPLYAPAMVCLMRDAETGRSVGVHRTFLHPDGSDKAARIDTGNRVLKAKSVLGNWGTIRIPPPNPTRACLAVSEGVENALAAQQLLPWEDGPVWACGNANSLAGFPVLAGVKVLTIIADSDRVGMQAARTCEARWREAGRAVEVLIPPPAEDWASCLTGRNG